jgi:hypothetical protein
MGSGVIQLGSGREVPKTFRILYFAAGKMLKRGENGWRSTENCLNPVLRGSMVLAVKLFGGLCWEVLSLSLAVFGLLWLFWAAWTADMEGGRLKLS